MANTKNNQQFKKTEEKIISSTLALMAQLPFEKITVRRICEEGQINRSTFYAHFIDVYDLLEKIELFLRKELEQSYMSTGMKQKGVNPFSQESLHTFLHYIHSHEHIYRVLFANMSTLPEHLYFPYREKLFDSFTPNRNMQTQQELTYYFTGFQGGMYMIIRKWLERSCQEPEEEIAKIIADCLPTVWRTQSLRFFCN